MLYGEGYDGAGLGALLAAATEAPPAPTDGAATVGTTGGRGAAPLTGMTEEAGEGAGQEMGRIEQERAQVEGSSESSGKGDGEGGGDGSECNAGGEANFIFNEPVNFKQSTPHAASIVTGCAHARPQNARHQSSQQNNCKLTADEWASVLPYLEPKAAMALGITSAQMLVAVGTAMDFWQRASRSTQQDVIDALSRALQRGLTSGQEARVAAAVVSQMRLGVDVCVRRVAAKQIGYVLNIRGSACASIRGRYPVVGLLCAGRLSQVHAMSCAHVWGMPTRA